MTIRLYDEHNIHQLEVSLYQQAHLSFLKELVIHQPASYIENVSAKMGLLQVDHLFIPITITCKAYTSSYVVSLYNQYITYAKEELGELNNQILEKILDQVLSAFGLVFKYGRLNQTVMVNNWLLSTNLYDDMKEEDLQLITEYLMWKFPEHAILFRSVCQSFFPGVYNGLVNQGYQPLLSRSINLFNAKSWGDLNKKQRKQLKNDSKLITQSGKYEVRDINDSTHAGQIIDLYNQLYIKKYSPHNPQLNSSFIKLALKHRFLHIKGIFNKGGQLKGVVGYYRINDMITAPLLGYDTSVPKEDSLYRMLTCLLTMEGFKFQVNIHRSSGVREFKRLRGSTNELEYLFFYTKHLPVKQKAIWNLFSAIYNKAGRWLHHNYQF